jgi:hypothetical protein
MRMTEAQIRKVIREELIKEMGMPPKDEKPSFKTSTEDQEKVEKEYIKALKQYDKDLKLYNKSNPQKISVENKISKLKAQLQLAELELQNMENKE